MITIYICISTCQVPYVILMLLYAGRAQRGQIHKKNLKHHRVFKRRVFRIEFDIETGP